MADETTDSATFELNIKDGSSGPAEAIAKQLEGLKKKIDADTTALGAMQKALRNLKQATTPNQSQIEALSKRIAEQKQSIAGAQSAYISLGGKFDAGKKGARGFAERLGDLRKTTQGMPGPLNGLLGSLGNLSGLVGRGVLVAGLAAAAAALVAIAAAAVVATAALLKYGIAAANAYRSERLQLEGLTKMRNWYGVAAGNAKEMQSSIDRVSGSYALGRDKIAQYAGELYKLHLRGKNFDMALEAMAIKGSVLGDEGARSFAQWAAGANMAGGSVKKLADDVKARFGAIAMAQMLDLNVQIAKMRENFNALFTGLNIEGLLKAFNAVTSLFSQSTRSGQALKQLMSVVLQPLINAFEYVLPIAKRFFQGLIIASLLFGIAVLRVKRWIRETFGESTLVNKTYLMRAALAAGAGAAAVLIAVLGTLALFVGAVGAQFYAAAAIGSLFWKWIGKGYDFIKSIPWAKLGKSIVEGVVNGIKGAAGWLIDTISNLGTDALNALSKTLGIASPSKAFARLGVAIPQGVAAGVAAGTPDARRTVEQLVDVPRIAPEPSTNPATPPTPRASSPTSVDLGGITIEINTSSGDAKGIAADVERELVPVLERIALQLGARLPAVPG